MGALFSAPSAPAVQQAPPAPSMTDATVQQAAADAHKRAQIERGRASTFLTNPDLQREAQPNQQRYLGGK